jgi:5'-nucleotidase
VLVAFHGQLGDKPDLVVSGINHGPNMGEDVLYSGTVSVAMEAVALGIPGIAFSLSSRDDDILASYQDVVARLVSQIVAVRDFPKEMLLNINLPQVHASEVKGIRVTKLGSRVFSESITRMNDPWGREVIWIGGGEITWKGDADSDHRAVHDGYISVTPLHLDLTNYPLLETVRGWSLEG